MVRRRAGAGLSGSVVGPRPAHEGRDRSQRRAGARRPRHRPHLAAARHAAFRRAGGRPVDADALRAANDRPGGALASGSSSSTRALRAQRRAVREGARGRASADPPGMYARLERAGIATANSRGLHILWQLRARRADVLRRARREAADVRVAGGVDPRAKTLERDEALAELARRYFTSHGPATVSGFRVVVGACRRRTRARRSPRRNRSCGPPRSTAIRIGWGGQRVRLYDKEWARAGSLERRRMRCCCRRTTSTPSPIATGAPRSIRSTRRARGTGSSAPTILLDGRIVGTWTRRLTGRDVAIR